MQEFICSRQEGRQGQKGQDYFRGDIEEESGISGEPDPTLQSQGIL